MNEQIVEGREEHDRPPDIEASLRSKYDVRAPRYTSYPPANHFGPIDLGALIRRWSIRRALESDPGLSLYVHIPFCRSRCHFCGCHTFVCNDSREHERYVEAVSSEMAKASEAVGNQRALKQLSLGGGTPNALGEALLDRLLLSIEKTFVIDPRSERSVEIDPRSVSDEQLDLLLDHGFNRFSLGVQDLSPSVLDVVGRRQGQSEVESVVDHLRRLRCAQINFDLIYGLPGQDVGTARYTAEAVVSLRPSRVALYSYAHVPWLRPHQRVLEKAGLPPSELKAKLFTIVAEKLLENGYVSIGLDHFALPEDPLAAASADGSLRRNFMGYTTGRGLDVLGVGVSAISSIGSSYSQNEKDLSRYLDEVRSGRLPVFRGFLLSRDDEVRRELLQQLSCNLSIDLHSLSRQFGVDAERELSRDLDRLDDLVNDGIVDRRGDIIMVNERGRPFLRNICMVFDRYLSQKSGELQYSRTI